jgi:hypothetical protein
VIGADREARDQYPLFRWRRSASPTTSSKEDLRATVLMHVVEPRLIDDADDRDRLIGVERNLCAERAADPRGSSGDRLSFRLLGEQAADPRGPRQGCSPCLVATAELRARSGHASERATGLRLFSRAAL